MTGFLETVIRPFQTRDVSPPRRSQTAGSSSSGGPLSVTVGGSATAGAQIAVTFASTAITGSPVTVQYTVVGGDTLQTTVLAIIAAINGNSALQAAGIFAGGVSGSPLQFTVNQPDSLSPRATISVAVIGTLSISLSGETVSISPGRERVQMKGMNGSHSSTISTYNKKWPKETTLDQVLAGNVPGFFPANIP